MASRRTTTLPVTSTVPCTRCMASNLEMNVRKDFSNIRIAFVAYRGNRSILTCRLIQSHQSLKGQGRGLKREQQGEGGTAVATASSSRSVKAVGNRRRSKAKRKGENTTAAAFRATMVMGQTYRGVTCYLPPGTNRCSVRLEGTPLVGFADIPPFTVCKLEQTVKVCMKLPDAAFPDATSLQLELV